MQQQVSKIMLPKDVIQAGNCRLRHWWRVKKRSFDEKLVWSSRLILSNGSYWYFGSRGLQLEKSNSKKLTENSFTRWQKSIETLINENQQVVLEKIRLKFRFREIPVQHFWQNWPLFQKPGCQTGVLQCRRNFYRCKIVDCGLHEWRPFGCLGIKWIWVSRTIITVCFLSLVWL